MIDYTNVSPVTTLGPVAYPNLRNPSLRHHSLHNIKSGGRKSLQGLALMALSAGTLLFVNHFLLNP